VGAPRPAISWSRPLLAGALGVLLVVAILGYALRPVGPGPGGPTTSPSPTPIVTPSPSPSPTTRPSATPAPTPEATLVGTLAATRLSLGTNAAPIAVTEAFGSIWVADIHASDVRRFDPVTMQELARIKVLGAAWFAVADDALWVTNQTGLGLTRIDPVTNTAVAQVGQFSPCGAPVVALDSLWQAGCDSNVMVRIDPARSEITDTVSAKQHVFLVLAAGRLISVGTVGLASLDPETGTFSQIVSPDAVGGADFLASDGTTVWLKNRAGMVRIDPLDGHTIATFAEPQAQAPAFAGDHAWLTVTDVGVREIDLATNEVIRTIPVLPAPLVPLEAFGALWVTDFDNSVLWRVDL
jgi:streptogramin lyase